MSVEAALPRPLPEGFLPPNCTYAEQDWPVLARQWFPLVRADDPLAKPRQVVLLNLRLAVYRMPDGIRIGRDMCPHRGLPLSSGRIEGEELVCAYHGLRFGSDGQCRLVPEKLAPKTADCFRITAFPAIERHGLIWTCLIPEDEAWMPTASSEVEATASEDSASAFKLSIESIEDSQKELALNEFHRLLNEIGFGSTPNALLSSGS
ncbi:Rieske 2Fe-2S domain-containing protein [Variovorax sp. W6]|uniref:Rieske 2Fe-2S domain-containing protein n=1 Tax=Variovorax sp. W6 TaxID=3093895 RepID=UPI003D804AB7